jgi:hypothetical protein
MVTLPQCSNTKHYACVAVWRSGNIAKGRALEEGERSGLFCVLFTPVERYPGNPQIGGWEGGRVKQTFICWESDTGLPTSNHIVEAD